MSEPILSVKDKLARATAEIDQAQACIDEARLKFANHKGFNRKLDELQFLLDLRKESVRILKIIADKIEL